MVKKWRKKGKSGGKGRRGENGGGKEGRKKGDKRENTSGSEQCASMGESQRIFPQNQQQGRLFG